MARDVVLFDLDGTLTDPAEGIFNSVRNALAALDLQPLRETELRGFIGPPLRESFGGLGLGPAAVEAAMHAYREHFADVGIFENRLYDGIDGMLRRLTAEGHRVAVATSKPTVFAERIVRHFALADHFDAVVGSELDGGRSAKHEVISETLRQLAAGPEHGIMVGDREHDVLGAAHLHMDCIGVAWGTPRVRSWSSPVPAGSSMRPMSSRTPSPKPLHTAPCGSREPPRDLLVTLQDHGRPSP